MSADPRRPDKPQPPDTPPPETGRKPLPQSRMPDNSETENTPNRELRMVVEDLETLEGRMSARLQVDNDNGGTIDERMQPRQPPSNTPPLPAT